jgi:hypothetical protein
MWQRQGIRVTSKREVWGSGWISRQKKKLRFVEVERGWIVQSSVSLGGDSLYTKKKRAYRPSFIKRRQPTKYQFYRRSKKMAPLYIWQMLWQVGYPPPILVILEDVVVIFLHITEDR